VPGSAPAGDLVALGLDNALVRLLGSDPDATSEQLSEEKLRELVTTHDALDEQERRILSDVFAATDTSVKAVMRPRGDVTFMPGQLTLGEAATLVRELPYSRYPVTGDGFDDARGFLHVRDLLGITTDDGRRVLDVCRPVVMLPASKRVLPSVAIMRQQGVHLGVVVDEYGGTDGIVTLEDLIEELIGESGTSTRPPRRNRATTRRRSTPALASSTSPRPRVSSSRTVTTRGRRVRHRPARAHPGRRRAGSCRQRRAHHDRGRRQPDHRAHADAPIPGLLTIRLLDLRLPIVSVARWNGARAPPIERGGPERRHLAWPAGGAAGATNRPRGVPGRAPPIAAAALSLAAAHVVLAARPGAEAAEGCTPSIAMGKPFQDPGGFVVFPATYSVCDATLVRIKFRDRDTDTGWGSGSGVASAGSSDSIYVATCDPDGQAHRWVAYATLKTPRGRHAPRADRQDLREVASVSHNCPPWTPPAG
jgi:CBS domain-containing protein